ncbi:DUF975 family protein [Companilactobacillus musae]|uniref:DUF975 family protein n=1 Tax=Companilactobacillus musae TaxID=1903258 RepID=UPI003413809A
MTISNYTCKVDLSFNKGEIIISRKQLKFEIKQLFKGNWIDAIKIAIIPIIFTILGFMIEGRNSISQVPSHNSATLEYSSLDLPSILSSLSIGILIILIAGLVFSVISDLFVQSANYSYLTWIREGNISGSTSKNIFRAWSKKYRNGVVRISAMIYIYTFLWSLLLIIPGIIKFFSYSQAFFVYKDQLNKSIKENTPKPTINGAISKSRELMKGHKWEYFVLSLSFIGWSILAGITLGIGFIWLVPYTKGTFVNYYNHLVTD